MKVENNRELVADIFERYGAKIYNLIARQVNDYSEIDDIYQQLFLSLIQGQGLSHDHNILGYLFKATTNHVIDAARLKKKYRQQTYRYAEYQRYRTVQESPQRITIQAEERQKRIKLIEKYLPRHEAKAITDYYIHDHNFPNLAKKMNIKKRTLSRYLCIGLKKVRQLLNDDTIEISASF